MAQIQATKVTPSDNAGAKRRQVYRVSSGLYGVMFAWYSLPKKYPVKMPKPGKPTEEERFYAGFVITHDRAGKLLPHFSDAMTGVRTTLFYDEKTGMRSTYVALIHALSAGKLGLQDVANMEASNLPDMDDYIGRPAWAFIEADSKPNDEGLIGRRIKSIEPMDKALWEASKELYNSRETQVTESGTARLVKPTAAFEDEVGGPSGALDGNPFDGDNEDPFL